MQSPQPKSRKPYEPPRILTYSAWEILGAIGPASARNTDLAATG